MKRTDEERKRFEIEKQLRTVEKALASIRTLLPPPPPPVIDEVLDDRERELERALASDKPRRARMGVELHAKLHRLIEEADCGDPEPWSAHQRERLAEIGRRLLKEVFDQEVV